MICFCLLVYREYNVVVEHADEEDHVGDDERHINEFSVVLLACLAYPTVYETM